MSVTTIRDESGLTHEQWTAGIVRELETVIDRVKRGEVCSVAIVALKNDTQESIRLHAGKPELDDVLAEHMLELLMALTGAPSEPPSVHLNG